MHKVAATDLARDFGRFEKLAQREPVAITSEGRENLVLLSAEEYRRLKRLDREVLVAGELPADLLAAIETAEMDPVHAPLDALMEPER